MCFLRMKIAQLGAQPHLSELPASSFPGTVNSLANLGQELEFLWRLMLGIARELMTKSDLQQFATVPMTEMNDPAISDALNECLALQVRGAGSTIRRYRMKRYNPDFWDPRLSALLATSVLSSNSSAFWRCHFLKTQRGKPPELDRHGTPALNMETIQLDAFEEKHHPRKPPDPDPALPVDSRS